MALINKIAKPWADIDDSTLAFLHALQQSDLEDAQVQQHAMSGDIPKHLSRSYQILLGLDGIEVWQEATMFTEISRKCHVQENVNCKFNVGLDLWRERLYHVSRHSRKGRAVIEIMIQTEGACICNMCKLRRVNLTRHEKPCKPWASERTRCL